MDVRNNKSKLLNKNIWLEKWIPYLRYGRVWDIFNFGRKCAEHIKFNIFPPKILIYRVHATAKIFFSMKNKYSNHRGLFEKIR